MRGRQPTAAVVSLRLDAARLSVTDVLSLGWIGLRMRPLRVALSAVGIAAGITTLVLVVDISSSTNAGLRARLDTLGANLILAQAQAQGNVPTRLVDDAQAMTLRIGPVTSAAELAQLHVAVRRSSRSPADDLAGLDAYAATPALRGVLHAHLLAGGFLTRTTTRMRAVVLGRVAAASLGIDARSLSAHPQIAIGNAGFTVVGILAKLPVTSGLDYGVFVGWDEAETTFGFDGRATSVYLRADQDAILSVSQVLGPTLLPQAAGLVNVSQPSTALAAQHASGTAASALVLALIGVALIVGGIGITNTMYVAVNERRREIGLRRALGATRNQIRTQFLAEAAVLAVGGSLLGAALGIVGSFAYAVDQQLPAALSWTAVAGGVLGGVAVGVLAGLLPASRAAVLTPTEALVAT